MGRHFFKKEELSAIICMHYYVFKKGKSAPHNNLPFAKPYVI